MEKLLGNREQGLLFIVSAPAGTGKTTLVQMLQEEFSCIIESISYTTRPAREGEVDGIHYNFIDRAAFEGKIRKGDFLEHVQLYGDYYGTSLPWVEAKLQAGNHVVLVIDTQGALKLKGNIPAILIFIHPPSLEELERRLRSRQTDTDEKIAERLEWAKHEMEEGSHYDYQIVNDNLETTYQVLRSIPIAEEHKSYKS